MVFEINHKPHTLVWAAWHYGARGRRKAGAFPSWVV